MDKLKTKEIENLLLSSKEVLDSIVQQTETIALSSYLEMLCKQKCVDISEIISRTLLDRTYTYQIFQGKKNPGRDKVLQIALALHLDLEETNRLLTLSKHHTLYVNDKRDAVLAYCVIHQYTVSLTNDKLAHYNLAYIE